MKQVQKFFVYTLFIFLTTPFVAIHGQAPADTAKKSIAAKPAAVYLQREQTASPQIKSRLSELRGQIAERKLTFNIGYTSALEKKLETLAGTRAPDNLSSLAEKQNGIASQMLQMDLAARDEYLKTHPGSLPELRYWRLPAPCVSRTSYDWRSVGKVTPVRDQDGCGSCWAFAAMGAYEGSYLIRNSRPLDTSEQHVLNCSGAGSCGGGWHAGVFDWLIKSGTASEVSDPYTATDHACKGGVAAPYRAVAWGYIKSDGGIPSVQEMKTALCEHGPLTVAVYATPLFQAYTGGVFNEMDTSHGINHDITLIGWNDSKHAWLIKNSWGSWWGETGGYGTERGYMWIDYNSNNIGYGAAWVQAQNPLYVLPRNFYEFIPNMRPFPGPLRKARVHKAANPGL